MKEYIYIYLFLYTVHMVCNGQSSILCMTTANEKARAKPMLFPVTTV